MKNFIYSSVNVVIALIVWLVFGSSVNEKRSTLFGRSVIVRRRKFKHRPFEIATGEVFKSFHCGLWSLAFEHKLGRSVSFQSIKDIKGSEVVV